MRTYKGFIGILIAIVFLSSCDRTTIQQRVYDCEKNGLFRINTYINHIKGPGMSSTIYNFDTYYDGGGKCLTFDQCDSAKKSDYSKAEVWLRQWEKIK